MRLGLSVRLLQASLAAGIGVAVAVGCGGSDTAAPLDDASAPGPDVAVVDGSDNHPESGLPPIDSGHDGDGDSSTTPTACKTSPDCHSGTCFEGICVCDAGSFIQPDGTCGPTPPLACMDQGGTCLSNVITCPSMQLVGSADANKSCGDFIAAVCCFQPATCKGPSDLLCCVSDSPRQPICTNGWRTCPTGAKAYSSMNTNACGG
jgi:hypothetical protein